MKTHIQTAHEYGVNQALKQAGYASVEDVKKEAAALGIVPDTAPAAADDKVASVLASLKIG